MFDLIVPAISIGLAMGTVVLLMAVFVTMAIVVVGFIVGMFIDD